MKRFFTKPVIEIYFFAFLTLKIIFYISLMQFLNNNIIEIKNYKISISETSHPLEAIRKEICHVKLKLCNEKTCFKCYQICLIFFTYIFVETFSRRKLSNQGDSPSKPLNCFHSCQNYVSEKS